MSENSDKRKRILNLVLFILIVSLMLGWSAYSLFGHQFLRSVYEGNSLKLFDKFLMRGRAIYPLETYLNEFDFRVNFYAALLAISSIFLFMTSAKSGLNKTESQTSAFMKLAPYFLVLAVSGVGWYFFQVTYETVDDAYHPLLFKNGYWYGYGGNDGYSLSFLHPALSWMLDLLYSYSHYYWYELTLWIANSLSFLALIMVSIQKGQSRKAPWILLISLFYFLPVFVKLQFSISAMLAAGAGTLLLHDSVSSDRAADEVCKKKLFFALFLIMTGCLIRFEAAMLSIAFVFASFLPVNLSLFLEKKVRAKRIAIYASVIAVAGIIVLVKPFFLPGGMERFWAANASRVSIAEYNEGLPGSIKQEILEKTGWTENDYLLIEPPILIDENIFNYDALITANGIISDWRKENPWSLIRIKWGNLFKSVRAKHLYAYLIITGLIVLAFPGRRNAVTVLFSVAVLFTIMLLMGIYFKPVPYRVYWGLFTLSSVTSLVLVSPGSGFLNNRYVQGIFLVYFALLVYRGSLMLYAENRDQRILHDQTVTDITQMMNNAAPEILAIRGDFCGECYYKPFREEPLPGFSRIPTIRFNLRATSSISRDYLSSVTGRSGPDFLCDNDSNILLITEEENLKHIETELQEHFGLRASFASAFEGKTFNAYRCNIL